MKTTSKRTISISGFVQLLSVVSWSMCLWLLVVSLPVIASKGTDGILMRLTPDNLAVVDQGAVIYQQQCAACHGAELQGQPNWRQRDANGLLPAPPHDETGHTWHHADDLLFEITKYGAARVINDPSYQSAMPLYENILSDQEIIAVLSFIKSRWPEQERQWQDEVNSSQLEDLGLVDESDSLIERLFK
ncbi:MAG: cytochrome c [Granulosicoccus sp.]|nr:cytochrome c [Granulosicoccus sp.]